MDTTSSAKTDVTRMQSPSLHAALATTAHISGSTHQFYNYPARFHPQIAREVISTFSKRGSWILDPFMGGGTSVIEGLSLGRRVIGNDINSLAHFIAGVRTRPLSQSDKDTLREWAENVANTLTEQDLSWVPRVAIRNFPQATELFISGALEMSYSMLPRRRDFARVVLLRLGQWALDCRDFQTPRRSHLAKKLPELMEQMLDGLQEFVATCATHGVLKKDISSRRVLLHRSAIGLNEDKRIRSLPTKPRLVFTSPPYPGVHVLYHRWQYRGRRETSAPYWIANVLDGAGEAHYCGGGRTPNGVKKYFQMIEMAFRSIAKVMHTDGRVVQIIGFSSVAKQLPAYLRAMEKAGYHEVRCSSVGTARITRRVANRKWYAKLQTDTDAATEYLLVHRIKN